MKQKSLRNFFILLMVATAVICVLSTCTDDKDNDEIDSEEPTEEEPYPLGSFVPPEMRGPYEVGVRTVLYVDHDRFQEYGKMPRALLTEIWYPTPKAAGGLNTINDMIGPLPPWAENIIRSVYGEAFDEMAATQTTAWRNTDQLLLNPAFPVVLFSHGLTAVRFQNFTMCEHLASHGFVVIAPDHYDNALFTNINGRIILFNPLSTVFAEFDRPRDIRFLVQTIQRRGELDGDFLENLIDIQRIGLFGHSYGGMTSYMAGSRIPEIQSVAPMNPVVIKDDPDNFTKPLLLLIGDEDMMASNLFDSRTRCEANWDEHRGNKSFVLMRNAGHYTATDACYLLPPSMQSLPATGCGGNMIDSSVANRIFAGYLTAFFSLTLKGDERYRDYLKGNAYPAFIDYAFSWDQ